MGSATRCPKSKALSIILLTMLVAASIAPQPAPALTMLPEFEAITAVGNDASLNPRASEDGTRIVFQSYATNLVDGAGDGDTLNIYLWDEGEITCLSEGTDGTGANGHCGPPEISDDGSTIVFHSFATNLVDVGASNSSNIFMWNESGLTCVSMDDAAVNGANEDCFNPQVSGNGDYVVFRSHATNLTDIAADGDNQNVYLWDGSALMCLSQDAGGNGADGNCGKPQVSDNGIVSFESGASNLVTGISGAGGSNMFVWDGDLTCISWNIDGTGGANGISFNQQMSADGSVVVFQSDADNLASGTENRNRNIYRWDGVDLTCITKDDNGLGANGDCGPVELSADGSTGVFYSRASNLAGGITGGNDNIYVVHGTNLECISLAAEGVGANEHCFGPNISADGSKAVFRSPATNLAGGVGNGTYENIYVWDKTGLACLTSLNGNGQGANGNSRSLQFIGDGSKVLFESFATNLVPGVGEGLDEDVFIGQLIAYNDVFFDSRDGEEPWKRLALPGDPITQPADPQKAGHRFLGWYTDPVAGELWDFTDPVTDGMTLYARFELIEEPPLPPTPDETATPTTVTPNPAPPKTLIPARGSTSARTGDGFYYLASLTAIVASGSAVAYLRKRKNN